jgi:hypothetical protein
MNYNFHHLNPYDFEHLIQALMQKILGGNSLVFGAGRDGARELTFNGQASFPNNSEKWKGYWVIQAKYKIKEDKVNDYNWIENQFTTDIEKFGKEGYPYPDNYIFLTNASLSPVAEVGGRDKIEKLKTKYLSKIKNIFIGGYDEVSKFLDNNRDVATAYASFILPGDILLSTLEYLNYDKKILDRNLKLINIFLQKEFKNECKSKLIQAGDLIREINLENVFVDLLIEAESNEGRVNKQTKAVSYIIDLGNNVNRHNKKKNKIVIIGGAGGGKSTITQFLCQYYTAKFLKHDNKEIEIVNEFINESFEIGIRESKCHRMPFKIVLKDYASWLNDKIDREESVSILKYIKYRINLIADGELDFQILRDILKKISFLFVFDGLDEVPTSSNRERVMKEINDFIGIELENSNCDALILATTRPQGYTREFNEASYNHFKLLEMTDEICLMYLNKLLKNIELSIEEKNSHLKTLHEALKNDITGRLMRTPLQATIMTILVHSGGEPSANKYQLFKKYYETIFNREKQKKVSRLINSHENHINKIHNLLGFNLQLATENSSNISSNMDKVRFEELISNYLKKEEWKKQEIVGFVEDLRNTITHRLVFITEVQDGKVGFIVRSLQEFFAASYYMDAKDNTIDIRLKYIATSSYWRNTLLFSIGYLRINKDYLVNNVYLLCEELNGLGDSPMNYNISTYIKSGSWLALDILTEGITNDSVKFSNMFAKLLLEIIDKPLIDDHSKFRKLDNRIKKEWISEVFLTNLLNNIEYITHVNTVFDITGYTLNKLDSSTSKTIKTLLYKNTTNDNTIYLLDSLYNNNQIDDMYLNLFKTTLIGSPTLTYEKIILNELKNPEFPLLNKYIDKYIYEVEAIRPICEYIMLIILNNNSNDIDTDTLQKVIAKISNFSFLIKDKRKSSRFPFLYFEQIEHQVFSKVDCVIIPTRHKNYKQITLFKSLSEHYEIKYLDLYYAYLISPSIEKLYIFLQDLYKQPEIVINKFNTSIHDWLLSYVLKEYSKLKHNISDLSNLLNMIDIYSDEDILKKEDQLLRTNNEMEIFKFSSYRTFRVPPSNAFIRNFFNKNLEKIINLNTDYLTMFFNLYYVNHYVKGASFRQNELDNVFKLLTNEKLFSNSLYETEYVRTWFCVFKDSSPKLLFKAIDNSDCFKEINISPKFHYFHFFFDTNSETSFLSKVISVFNAFINLESNNSIIRLVSISLINNPIVGAENMKSIISNINFEILRNIRYVNLNDRIGKFLILLFSPINYEINMDTLLKHFESLVIENNDIFSYLVNLINSYNIDSNWVIDFVLKISKLNCFKQIELSSSLNSYYTFLKNNLESAPALSHHFIEE